jgi:AraC-like DNA-binding protein
VGLSDAGTDYYMSRPSPPQGHLLACTGGSGRVLVDGQWQHCAAGQAYLSPPRAPMAFETVGKTRWQFAWVYFEAAESPISGATPYLAPVDPRQLAAAIEGLYREVSSGPSELVEPWAHLVAAHARRMVAPPDRPDPLWPLWARVDARLAEPWTLQQLADEAAMAPEALRRLCHRTIARSPMRQVMELRMRRAQTMLESTPAKIYSVAKQVGYQNVFAFSAAFKRWSGRSPSDCRPA